MPATHPPPSPDAVTPEQGAVAASDDAREPRPRQCGRCRAVFEGDPTLHSAAIPDWWLCPPCRAALLGGTRAAAGRSAPSR